ncbi:MAG: hypothetical protein HUN04_20790 [Desulfobacter sp.]|nr:MAG: hypothetical protein HUN04_20790 [Desulfobacter sp.]
MSASAPGQFPACLSWRRPFSGLLMGLLMGLGLALGTVSAAPAAAEDTELDLLLDSFESETAAPVIAQAPEFMEDERISLYGALSLSSAFRTDPGSRDRLAELAGKLVLKSQADLGRGWRFFMAAQASHDLAPALGNPVEDDYRSSVERELEAREIWVERSLAPWLDLKLGRQIVAWGTSEVFRLVDVVNPTDQREFGMTDIEDLRLGQAMSRLDMYSGPWNLTLVMLHGDRTPRTPAWGSEFYPSDTPLPPLDDDNFSLDRPRFAAALSGRFTGWDAGLYLARVHDDRAFVYLDSGGHARLRYPKINMAGLTLTKSMGNFLVKCEAAFFDGLRFSREPDRSCRELDTLAGVEYSGFTDTTLTVEVVNHHLFSPGRDLEQSLERMEKDHWASAFRLAREFKNDTVHLTLVAGFMGVSGDLGSFQRGEVEVDLSDTLSVKFGGVLYHDGESSLFNRIENNDRVFFSVSRDFSLDTSSLFSF